MGPVSPCPLAFALERLPFGQCKLNHLKAQCQMGLKPLQIGHFREKQLLFSLSQGVVSAKLLGPKALVLGSVSPTHQLQNLNLYKIPQITSNVKYRTINRKAKQLLINKSCLNNTFRNNSPSSSIPLFHTKKLQVAHLYNICIPPDPIPLTTLLTFAIIISYNGGDATLYRYIQFAKPLYATGAIFRRRVPPPVYCYERKRITMSDKNTRRGANCM